MATLRNQAIRLIKLRGFKTVAQATAILDLLGVPAYPDTADAPSRRRLAARVGYWHLCPRPTCSCPFPPHGATAVSWSPQTLPPNAHDFDVVRAWPE